MRSPCRTVMWHWAVCAACILFPFSGARAQGGATATGVSRELNPAISVNGLFLGAGYPGLPQALQGDEAYESGLMFQEAEIQFTAAIDPYAKADVIFTYEGGTLDVEEVKVTSDVLSHGIGLRAGRFFVPLGYENTLHTHQLPFINRSLVHSAVFGDALGEFGLEAAYVPILPWYVEIRGAVFNGDSESVFAAPGEWDLAYLGGFDVLWTVGEGGTFSLGADGMAGPNGLGNDTGKTWSQLVGTVLRYKWRSPRRSREHGAEVVAEYLYAQRNAAAPEAKQLDRGAYGLAKFHVTRRWWLQGRYDYHVPSNDLPDAQRGSFLVAFVPSEFSAIRLQGSVVDELGEAFGEVLLQFNFTIGSHPAHTY